jgi:YggT family protein
MFVLANLVLTVARTLELVLWAYFWIIIARTVISWVSADPYNPLVRFLYRVTEPVLEPLRRRLPTAAGLDFSPLLVLLALRVVDWFLVDSLYDLASRLR